MLTVVIPGAVLGLLVSVILWHYLYGPALREIDQQIADTKRQTAKIEAMTEDIRSRKQPHR